MASRQFTKEDFAKWNTTTSVFHVPKRLVGKGKIPQLRADFVKAIGADRVSAVQILPNHKVRVQFKSPSIRVRYDINGLSFRGVTLTPFPAYEEVKSVFVDRALLQMGDNYLFEALAPYGRVISVQHLTVCGFPTIKTGTRMVSMSVHTSILAELKVAGFTLAFRYRGQLPTCYVCQEGFDLDLSVRLPKTAPSSSSMDKSRHVSSSTPLDAESTEDSDIPLSEEVTMEEANSNCGPLTDDDMLFDFESCQSGSDVESLSEASTTSSLEEAAEFTEHLLKDAADASHSLEDAATLLQTLDRASVAKEDGSSSLDH
ncbi:Hypothetical predicted protein [Paramuricea clavata]|uniref:Uncharacterized protein n=1 Tax=Paramuricea clavata TaxID=317549 RepID=A0A6S7ICF3_PARCT|nr:Hypothetical predicted protein [Paramuricea clavata]